MIEFVKAIHATKEQIYSKFPEHLHNFVSYVKCKRFLTLENDEGFSFCAFYLPDIEPDFHIMSNNDFPFHKYTISSILLVLFLSN